MCADSENTSNVIVLFYVLILGLFASQNLSATLKAEPISYLDLREPSSIPISFEESEFLLIEASQSFGDVGLRVFDSNERVVARADIPAKHWLKEYLLLKKSDCSVCVLQVFAADSVSRSSKTELTVRKLDSKDSERIKFLQSYKVIARKFKSPAKNKFSELERDFHRLLNSDAATVDAVWKFHAQFLKSEMLHTEGKYGEQIAVLSDLYNESLIEAPEFATRAVVELGSIAEDHEIAFSHLDNAVDLANAHEFPRLQAMALSYKGLALVREGQIRAGIGLFKQSFEIYQKLEMTLASLTPLYNLGWAHQEAGDLPQALAYMAQLRFLGESIGSAEHLLWALYEMATVYGDMGYIHSAESLLDEAIVEIESDNGELLDRALGELPGFILQEKAELLFEYGDYYGSLDYAKRAEERYKKGGYVRDQTNAVYHQARALVAQKDFVQAQQMYELVLKEDLANNHKKNAALTQYELAAVHEKSNQLLTSANYLVSALEGLKGTDHYASLAKALNLSGKLMFRLGHPKRALQTLRQAVPIAQQGANQHVVAETEHLKARVLTKLGNYSEAKESLASGREIIEDLLNGVARKSLRRNYLALHRELFALNIEITIKQTEEPALPSLYVAEEFRARTLKESMGRERSQYNDSISAQEVRQILQNRLQARALAVHSQHSTDSHEAILAESRKLAESLEKLEIKLALEVQRKEKQARFSQGHIEVQNISHADEIGLYYFLAESTSWLWVVSHDETAVYELPAQNELAYVIQDALDVIRTHPANRTNSQGAFQQKKAIALASEMLLAPLRKHIKEAENSKLVIYADGLINQIPFSVLQHPESGEPLVLSHSIRYAPSLDEPEQRGGIAGEHVKENAHLRALIVANPSSNEPSKAYATLQPSNLPHSSDEAAAIASLPYGEFRVMEGNEASKRNVLDAIGERYDILHFATHAYVHPVEPALTGLLFSDDTSGQPIWLVPEIETSQLTAQLAVLSACESASGRLIAGEGAIGLSRAFFDAGIPQVVGSFWKVQDDATATLMKTFYNHLLAGKLSPPSALRRAQLIVLKDKNNNWRDPYFWAGFAVFGSGKAIVVSEQDRRRNSI